ncbi:MAG: hypothetical protein H0Z32_03850 [Bacillaceae bacterium]|nr:hypothetical protein [Bacillaceae bacterium]
MNRTRFLLRTAAIYGLIGAFIGSHMAGAGSYIYRSVHAHILVVGWLSLFAFSVYYKLFPIPKQSKLAFLHVWTAFLGSIGLTAGMWFYYVQPFPEADLFNMIFFIIGGTILLISFILFAIMTFVHGKYIQE